MELSKVHEEHQYTSDVGTVCMFVYVCVCMCVCLYMFVREFMSLILQMCVGLFNITGREPGISKQGRVPVSISILILHGPVPFSEHSLYFER